MGAISDLILTFLLNALWQVALVAGAAIVCSWLLRHHSASHRHLLWALAFISSVALPLWSLHQSRSDNPHPLFLFASDITARSLNFNIFTQSARSWPGDVMGSKGVSASGASTLAAVLAACYTVFLFYRVIRLWNAWRKTHEIWRGATAREIPALMQSVVVRCQASLGVKRVSVLCSSEIAGPLTLGARSPAIILPESLFAETSAEVLTSVLGHEMAHIRRHDFLFNLVYELLYSLVAFHPAATLMKRRIDQTREMTCDQIVTANLVAAPIYARSLLRLATTISDLRNPGQAIGIFDGDVLEQRVTELISVQPLPNKRAEKLLLSATAFILACSCGVAARFSLNIMRDQSQAAKAAAASSFLGRWEGTLEGVPWVSLVVTPTGDELSGTVNFYLLKKTEAGFEVADSTGDLPIIDAKSDGHSLSFRVKRKLSSDIVRAEMNLVNENEAILRFTSAEIKGGESIVKVKRKTLAAR